MTTCDICKRPMPSDTAHACTGCAARLRRTLYRLGDLLPELTTTIARQGRSGDHGGRTGGAAPLPYSPEASDVEWAVGNVLSTWARHVAETRGHTTPTSLPACARWLAQQVDWLRHRPEIAEVDDELSDACRMVERAVDRHVDRWYAGPCDGCPEDLYALPGASTVRCRGCGAEYDAGARKAQLLKSARDHLATAALASAALSILGAPIPAATVRKWAQRGRILAHGVDRYGAPLYRVGEVIDLRDAGARRREPIPA